MQTEHRIRVISQLPWKPAGLCLDPFASEMKWWVGVRSLFEDYKVVYSDINPSSDEVVQADAANLPFPDVSFDQIWADPPHLIRNDVKHWTKGYARFGNYKNRKELETLWPIWAKEFHRVCKETLVLKTVDGGDHRVIKRADLKMFEPYWTKIDEVQSKTSPGWSKTITLYTKWKRNSHDHP